MCGLSSLLSGNSDGGGVGGSSKDHQQPQAVENIAQEDCSCGIAAILESRTQRHPSSNSNKNKLSSGVSLPFGT